MTIWEWLQQPTFHCHDFADLAALASSARHRTVSLILPTRNVADTILAAEGLTSTSGLRLTAQAAVAQGR